VREREFFGNYSVVSLWGRDSVKGVGKTAHARFENMRIKIVRECARNQKRSAVRQDNPGLS
jgi:hypothetical protein